MKKLFYIGALSALLLTACNEEEVTETAVETVEEVEEVQAEQIEVAGVTMDEFEAAYKDKLTAAFMPSAREQSDTNRYAVALDTNIFLFMEVDGDEVNKVTVAATTDSFNDQKQKIKIAFDALIKTADESLNDTQLEKLYSDLNITWDLNMLDQTEVKTFNDFKYTYKADNETASVLLQIELK